MGACLDYQSCRTTAETTTTTTSRLEGSPPEDGKGYSSDGHPPPPSDMLLPADGTLPPLSEGSVEGVTTCPRGRRISSELDHLDALNDRAGWSWCPSSLHIRPDKRAKERKQDLKATVSTMYASNSDYILDMIFEFPTRENADGKIVVPREPLGNRTRRFRPNEFPYQLPPGTQHWVMWYSYGPAAGLSEGEINNDIDAELRLHLGHEEFDFAWYENPKMTIPEIYHVQVFWRDRRNE